MSSKTTQIQNIEYEISDVLRVNDFKLSNVERHVMKLQEEVLGRPSDIQCGIEV
jgi:hypothetical protein